MNEERWERLGRLLERSLALSADDRASFVDRSAGDDPELRDELLSLLEASTGADEYLRHLRDEVLGSDVYGALEEAFEGGDPVDPWIGRTVSRYRIVDRLGGGGMGVVYRATDVHLGRQVALKFIAPEIGRDAGARRRFLREARTASSLDHPNICTIHEIGETDGGRLFIVMAVYDGETLRERIDRGRLRVEEGLGIATQVARALAVAHERGIVHRDVKPDNIFVTSDGLVKLLDFGLARTPGPAMTGSDAVHGTVAYMSPERARGGRADERGDVWALGVILFEMLAGTRPFVADDAQATLDLIATADPDLGALPGDVPARIVDVLRGALSRDRGERIPDGRELLAGLEGVRPPEWTGRAGAAAGVAAHPRARRPRVLLATAATLGFVILAGVWRWPSGADPTAPASVAVLPFTSETEETDELADTLAEEVSANLAFVPGLRVRSPPRETAADQAPDPRSVGRRLGVATIVHGSARRVGERMTVDLELLDARSGEVRWTGSHEWWASRDPQHVKHVAFAIADSLRLHIAPFEPNEYTANERAYQRFLQGVYSHRRYTREDIWAALQFYREAYEEDPAFALAHAISGNAYIALTNLGIPQKIGLERAREHVDRSLVLDSALAEGHAALGFLRIWGDRAFEEGERSLRRAAMLYPTLPQARAWYGWYALLVRGWRDAAVANLRRALEVDPLNAARSADLERLLFAARRYEDVLEQHEVTRSLDADVAAAVSASAVAAAHRELGRYAEAVAGFESIRERRGDAPSAGLAITYARMGRDREARTILDDLRERADGSGASTFDIATVYANLGELDRAFEWLARTEERRPYALLRLAAEPALDPIRADPRYAELLSVVGFPPHP